MLNFVLGVLLGAFVALMLFGGVVTFVAIAIISSNKAKQPKDSFDTGEA